MTAVGAYRSTKNAIGYVRVSSAEQAKEGLSIDIQTAKIKAYAAIKELALREIIEDPGVSGAKKKLAVRPGGKRVLDMASSGKINAVIMVKLDRGFRNAGDCLNTVEEWDLLGISLHIIDLGGNSIDTTSAAGKFMITVLAGAAEMERNHIVERTVAALEYKRSRGERWGTVPYGWDCSGDKLTENTREQEVLSQIKHMRDIEYRSYRYIARRLNNAGVPSKTGKKWKHPCVQSVLERIQQ